jgi:gas vesicle structural protein
VNQELEESESLSLCEALDRVLHKGVALRGDIVLSVADVDLVYLGLQLLLCSTETARRAGLVLPSPLPSLSVPGGGT